MLEYYHMNGIGFEGLYWDNGKENGNYYLWFRVLGFRGIGFRGFRF